MTRRELLAELYILERYDTARSLRIDDYGSGQRYAELRRRRQLVGERTPADVMFERDELAAAFKRVGEPRRRRARRELALYGSRGVRITVSTWDDIASRYAGAVEVPA